MNNIPKTVVLTFDDAVSNHAAFVAPLLRELGFQATFFICCKAFDFETDKQQNMTWEQIQSLRDFELGNHLSDHSGVKELTPESFVQKYEELEAEFAAHSLPRSRSFAYPGGPGAEWCHPILKQLGCLAARSVAPRGWNLAKDSRYNVPALVCHGETEENFRAALKAGNDGSIPVLLYHGCPDVMHPWVHTPPELFEREMRFLKAQNYRVLAFRDLF